ncbi:SDR family NAD(P)-dependent oxidoreductase [Streptomyces sp. MBT65]|uniref:SDR family NAD(P)-dependent oxidoreductase n=1 Tax=Streptomyces sp. MBT65 TaxID=1488395 RepID=UPI00190E1B35|nr:SDR family NAD(P)-dependent oxidoreductase [Streptomyces sp. MBT65]MBK3578573.1 SDR family NAD(P)-dependent oxidoreductase [Streptomyces sp. MBT65]
MSKQVLVVGGTSGIGRELAAAYARQGASVIIAGRDSTRAEKAAAELNTETDTTQVRGTAVDLSKPESLEQSLSGIDHVDAIVLTGMRRDNNTIADYDIAGATELAIAKIVGYTTVVHTLRSRLSPTGSVLLFGGLAKDVPYPGSTTVTTVNAGVTGLVATLAKELAPVRVNAVHPGMVGDSPYWADNQPAVEAARARILTRVVPTMRDIVEGSMFLLENPAANGVNLDLNGGHA